MTSRTPSTPSDLYCTLALRVHGCFDLAKAGIRDGLHLIALSRLVRDRARVCVRALDAPAFCSLGLGREPLGARKFVAAISKRRLTVSATGDLALAQNVAWRPRWFLGVSALRRAPTWRAAGRSRLKNST